MSFILPLSSSPLSTSSTQGQSTFENTFHIFRVFCMLQISFQISDFSRVQHIKNALVGRINSYVQINYHLIFRTKEPHQNTTIIHLSQPTSTRIAMSSSSKTAVRIKQEPGLNNKPPPSGANKIKQEPSPTGFSPAVAAKHERLTSFRAPRDLTLGGIPTQRATRGAANKKVYTPNLNAARNKNVYVYWSQGG